MDRFQAHKPACAIRVFVCQQDILLISCLVCGDDLAAQWCREWANPLGALDSRRALPALQLATCCLEAYMHKFTALRLRRIGHAHCDTVIPIASHPDIALNIVVTIRREFTAAIDV